MDGIQFGQWFHERRRACGFASQRALAAKVYHDASLTGISEAFLARLESGQLAHPFRGAVRQRVLGMARYLCHTPRELTHYLRVAELTDLTESETVQITRLRQQLIAQPGQKMLVLPPRRTLLPGHEEKLEQLLALLQEQHGGLYLITGLPGSGKSTLVSALVYHIAQEKLKRTFSHGILFFSCRGYHGQAGLAALCRHLLFLFESHLPNRQSVSTSAFSHDGSPSLDLPSSLAHLINQLRQKLSRSSLLIVLDDVEATFPLRQIAELLTPDTNHLDNQAQDAEMFWSLPSTLLVTSRYVFPASFVTHHLSINAPGSLQQATNYFTSLLTDPLRDDEEQLVKQLCERVAYHPLLIEGLVTLIKAGTPLSLLVASPLDSLLRSMLTSDHDLRDRLDSAFQDLSEDMRKSFAILASMDTTPFSLEHATASSLQPVKALKPVSKTTPPGLSLVSKDLVEQPETVLAQTALLLGQFVRYSLLEVRPASITFPSVTSTERASLLPTEASAKGQKRVDYHMHPLLRVYGSQYLPFLSVEEQRTSKRNIMDYALTYLEHHQGTIRAILQERNLLFHAFTLALEQDRFEEVIRLVDGLIPISCRLQRREDGDLLFSQGLQVSQRSHNYTQQAHFLYNLGWLQCQRGEFHKARQTWEEVLAMTRRHHLPIWEPLLGLAHIAHLHREIECAQHYVEQYEYQNRNNAESLSTLSSQVRRAGFLRLQGKRDQAYALLATALQSPLLLEQQADEPAPWLLEQQARIELGRVLGEYQTTQQFTWELASYLRQQEEPYALAYILLNQAEFAQQHQQWNEIADMAHMILAAAKPIDAAFFRHYGTQLLHMMSPESLAKRNHARTEH
ncbi:hypothetical protein KDA_49830 [Dictyobacter alpinus]|uniref:AAA+ ATPase domain-containing protein n=1 Tax=Dictyobacter alpinus TaxID=2014873 RepID=A0A402BDU6_9CHLR|nr:AAA family ATPase [Dictyobacter alpinus]GCE29499.1 hypothetical protein KDA_49830 [Dictyobacter alpinus]